MNETLFPEAVFEPNAQEREKCLDTDGETSEFLWCLHCTRAYSKGYFRQINDLQMCPYSRCGGDAVIDAWDWGEFRAQVPIHPEVPEIGKEYPLYPEA